MKVQNMKKGYVGFPMGIVILIWVGMGCDPFAGGDGDSSGTDGTDSEDTASGFTLVPSNVDPGAMWGEPTDVLFQGSGCASWAEINTDSCEVGCVDDVVCEILTQKDGTEVAVVFARNFKVADNVRLSVEGSLPLIILATSIVHIDGLIHAINPIRNEHGWAGGYSCTSDSGPHDGNGPGGGGSSLRGRSAGGGGYCGVGGNGGAPLGDEKNLGIGGHSYGNNENIPLRGGSAGGKNELQAGGAGGGAIQIVSAVSISVGKLGVINASGNGGDANEGNGGGSGGAILMEAPIIDVAGVLAANGGSGGSADLYGDGYPGSASDVPVPGGSSDTCADGGDGAAGDFVNGFDGQDEYKSGPSNAAGGGGGGAGWIRLNTLDGTVNVTGTISPLPESPCTSFGEIVSAESEK